MLVASEKGNVRKSQVMSADKLSSLLLTGRALDLRVTVVAVSKLTPSVNATVYQTAVVVLLFTLDPSSDATPVAAVWIRHVSLMDDLVIFSQPHKSSEGRLRPAMKNAMIK